MKQLGLAFLQYNQDYDEYFPIGYRWDSGQSGPTTWPQEIAPYVKSVAVFSCPDDSLAGIVDPNYGIAMSYAVNGEVWFNWGQPNPGHLVGPSGGDNIWAADSTGVAALSQAAITRPTDSILLNERWSSDCNAKWAGSRNWASKWDHNNITDGGTFVLPDGTLALTPLPAGFDNGLNGSVSVHKSGIANFCFIDGHVKAMHPAATHPRGWADNSTNMWDARRTDGNASTSHPF